MVTILTLLYPTHGMTWQECGAVPDFHLMTVMQWSPSGVSYEHGQRSLEDPRGDGSSNYSQHPGLNMTN